MPAFRYQALDTAGRTEKGVLQADTARAARATLRERGLHPMAVAALADDRAQARLSARAQVLFARQLATLFNAGLPLDEVLAATADGADPATRGIALALRAKVMEGSSLARALADFPASFSLLFRASVAAGEQAGRLGHILDRLADHLDAGAALRRRLLAALAYPALLLLVALLVVAGLMLYVVPEVTAVFLRSGQALPWATRALLAISAGLGAALWWLLPALALGAAALAARWRAPVFVAWRHRLWLRLPWLRGLLHGREAGAYLRTLALLGGAAMPLLDAMRLAAETVGNVHLRADLALAATRVREGAALSRALAQCGWFPPLALRLIGSGERAGRLDAMLGEAAAQLDRALDATLSVLLAMLAPLVILLVGALVLFIVLAILLPIFQLNQLVQ